MFSEDDLLPISGLQHLAFCERQFALIHIEQMWEENRLTAEGRILHERVHELGSESRGDVRIARGLRLRSLRLGLAGMADAVEFHREQPGAKRSPWAPFPVEYKRGKPKPDSVDEVQLCAQALCLEEMLGVSIASGAIYYGQPRRRHRVEFTAELRGHTEALAARMHEMVAKASTPPAVYEAKCDRCSLVGLCLPKATGGNKSATRYIARAVREQGEANA